MGFMNTIKFMKELKIDARRSFEEYSKLTGMPVSTLADIYKTKVIPLIYSRDLRVTINYISKDSDYIRLLKVFEQYEKIFAKNPRISHVTIAKMLKKGRHSVKTDFDEFDKVAKVQIKTNEPED